MMHRRQFLGAAAAAGLGLQARAHAVSAAVRRPNLVYVFADQWRAQATGYAGDPNVRTPNADALARESINFATAVSSCPVCSPYRASLLTGSYPLRHGVFLNNLYLGSESASAAELLSDAGYRTGYIGKWHLDGLRPDFYIPPDRRQGFEFWRAHQCQHRDYHRSHYYAEGPEVLVWPGYDAIAQTREAQRYIEAWDGAAPFALFLAWGPPHHPYDSAPEMFRRMYDPARIALRPNVPEAAAPQARSDLAGYYAHCSALDACLGGLLASLRRRGIADDTLFVFTSDHGDMLDSHGAKRKQQPWDESVRVPLLMRFPRALGPAPRTVRRPIATPDILPTLLSLLGVEAPPGLEGEDLSNLASGRTPDTDAAALIACYSPHGEWRRRNGGREYRGVRTQRHTYVRSLDGPWLLYDNENDPYQLENLCGRPEHAALQAALEDLLAARLRATGDAFEPGQAYLDRWGIRVDERGSALPPA